MSSRANNQFKDNPPPDIDEVINQFFKKISAIFGGSKRSGSGQGFEPKSGFKLLLPVLVVLGLIWFGLGVNILDEKEKAVVLRLGKFHSILNPGFNWNPYLIDQVYRAQVTTVIEYQVSGLMLTKDENIVRVPLTVQYNIKSIKDYVLSVNDPVRSLRHATDSAVRHAVGSTNLDDVLGEGRALLADEVKSRIQSYLDSYGAGIKIITVTIQEAQPPSAVKQAFDDVIAAKEDKDRYKNEAEAYRNGILPEARGNAQRIIEEANAYKGKVIAQAEGETERFEQLLAEYSKAKDVTRTRLYVETVEQILQASGKVLIDVEGGNNMMYLPLDQILNQQKGSDTTSTPNSRQIDEQLRNSIVDQVIQELTKRANSNYRNGGIRQ